MGFLYMGVSGMNGIQWWDRVLLLFMPVKHHPSVTYVKRVKTLRMFLFTFLQTLGLVLLRVVKSTPAALAFPVFVVMMIPYRWLMKFIFTETELDALDGPTSGQNYDKDDDEEEDFYEAANAVPTNQPTQIIHNHSEYKGHDAVSTVFTGDCELVSSNWSWNVETNGEARGIGPIIEPANICKDGILVTITDYT